MYELKRVKGIVDSKINRENVDDPKIEDDVFVFGLDKWGV